MKQKLTLRGFIIMLTGVLFAAYAAYYAFVIIRDIQRSLAPEKIAIYAILVLLFGLLAGFAWTSEVKSFRFLEARKTVMIIVLLAVIALKLRLIGKIIAALEDSSPQSLLYCGSYFSTLAALLLLFVFYAFILRRLEFHPRAAVILPSATLILFIAGLVFEAILFFGFGIGLEANSLRTMVSRSIFYLSFIGLSAYFLLPPPIPKQ